MFTLVDTALALSHCIRDARENGATERELYDLKVAMQNLAKAVVTLLEYGVG